MWPHYKMSAVDFDKVLEYDNKRFVSSNYKVRHDFLKLWTTMPDTTSLVALGNDQEIVGYGCLVPAFDNKCQVAPLYADDAQIAEGLLRKLLTKVNGRKATIDVW